MVDGYAGHKAPFAKGITELGCWAHARRKFFEAHAASGSSAAKEAIERTGAIYAIDPALRDLAPEARYRERQRLLAPTLTSFKQWLDELQPKVLGNTSLVGAISYTQKRWHVRARVLDEVAIRSTIAWPKPLSVPSPSAIRTGSSADPNLLVSVPPRS